MYYVETRADNSGYANHRLTCLVVMGSPPVICISRVICPCFDYIEIRDIFLV
jgi:hypothetical protein